MTRLRYLTTRLATTWRMKWATRSTWRVAWAKTDFLKRWIS